MGRGVRPASNNVVAELCVRPGVGWGQRPWSNVASLKQPYRPWPGLVGFTQLLLRLLLSRSLQESWQVDQIPFVQTFGNLLDIVEGLELEDEFAAFKEGEL